MDLRRSVTALDQMNKISESGVGSICSIETLTPMISTCDELQSIKLPELILDCAKSKSAHTHQFSDVTLRLRSLE
jgi:hypothetical protein